MLKSEICMPAAWQIRRSWRLSRLHRSPSIVSASCEFKFWRPYSWTAPDCLPRPMHPEEPLNPEPKSLGPEPLNAETLNQATETPKLYAPRCCAEFNVKPAAVPDNNPPFPPNNAAPNMAPLYVRGCIYIYTHIVHVCQ